MRHFHHSQKKKEEVNSAIKRRKGCQLGLLLPEVLCCEDMEVDANTDTFSSFPKKKEEINSAIKRRKRCQFKGFYSLKCLALTYPWDFNKFPAKRFCKWTSLSRVLTSNSLSNLQGNVGSQKRHSPSGHLRLKGSSKH